MVMKPSKQAAAAIYSSQYCTAKEIEQLLFYIGVPERIKRSKFDKLT